MEDEIIRLKRRLIEIESTIDVLDLHFEKQKIEKSIDEISRFGRIIQNETDLNVDLLKTATLALKSFIQQVEKSEEYNQELNKEDNEQTESNESLLQ